MLRYRYQCGAERNPRIIEVVQRIYGIAEGARYANRVRSIDSKSKASRPVRTADFLRLLSRYVSTGIATSVPNKRNLGALFNDEECSGQLSCDSKTFLHRKGYRMRKLEGTRFQPWVGSKYRRPTLLPYRTLIVGESAYVATTRLGGDHISMCVRKAVTGVEYSRIWTGITSMLAGKRQSEPEQLATWCNQVAFHDYVQVAMSNSRERPSDAQFKLKQNRIALQSVLTDLRPQLIIVLGFATWHYIEGECGEGPYLPYLPPVVSKEDDLRQSYWFQSGKRGKALAVGVGHPSRTFPFLDWHRWLQRWMITLRDLSKVG